MFILLNKDSDIQKLKKLLAKNTATKKGFDAKKFCGLLKTDEHPLEIQKRLRDEWED
jgi:hypothetical protein